MSTNALPEHLEACIERSLIPLRGLVALTREHDVSDILEVLVDALEQDMRRHMTAAYMEQPTG